MTVKSPLNVVIIEPWERHELENIWGFDWTIGSFIKSIPEDVALTANTIDGHERFKPGENIFITRDIVELFTEREIDALIAHELGHHYNCDILKGDLGVIPNVGGLVDSMELEHAADDWAVKFTSKEAVIGMLKRLANYLITHKGISEMSNISKYILPRIERLESC